MSMLADVFGIPNEALTLLFLIALSLVNWIKNRFLEQQEQKAQEQAPDDPLRDVVWRRQMGEPVEQREFHREAGTPPPIPRGTIRLDPRPPVRPPTRPPVVLPTPTVVTKREAALASAFEEMAGPRSRRRRTGHRKQIDALLRSPSAAQNAILLTEILGPPVALKAHEDSFI